jgi:hypothetical protein
MESIKFINENKEILKNYISHVLDLKYLKEGINLARDASSSSKVVIKIV